MSKLRLKVIASFIEKEDRVADIGCDHAYLPIYLVQNQMCKSVIASDIHPKALNSAKINIEKENLAEKIPLFLSDGLENLDQKNMDTLILSGMGTSTILQILKKVDKENIKKIILQSNNDLYSLRKKIRKYGYYLQQEKVVFEKGHYYVIGKYLQKKKKLKKQELYFGFYLKENKDYYHSLQEELKKINEKISYKHFKKKMEMLYKLYLLKKYL